MLALILKISSFESMPGFYFLSTEEQYVLLISKTDKLILMENSLCLLEEK